MEHADVLLTIAEVSIALAGFTGVAVALRAGRGGLEEHDRLGLIHILAGSGLGIVFSLLPSIIHALGVSETASWRVATGGLGVSILAGSALWVAASRRVSPRFPRVFWGFVVAGVGLSIALIGAASPIFSIDGTLLPLGLLFCLMVAFSQFTTFLLMSDRAGGS